jgi:hypothetical protein
MIFKKSNLKSLLEELSINYQNMKSDHENTKRMFVKINQEKEESIEAVKRQFERQKQKELETIREYISKVMKIIFLKHLIFF